MILHGGQVLLLDLHYTRKMGHEWMTQSRPIKAIGIDKIA